jgi:SAM-dependent methyltransferase
MPSPAALLESPLVAQLRSVSGDWEGKRVLDCGCGTGDLSCALAATGATVVGFDAAVEPLGIARRRAADLELADRMRLVQASFEELPLPSGSVDMALGIYVLHHVDLPRAMAELSRVLRPGGRAIFQENQLTNPLLRFAWMHLTGNRLVAKFSSPDEFPLVGDDYREMRETFPVVKLHYPQFEMLSMANRNVFKYHPRWRLITRTLSGVDEGLARVIPPLRAYGFRCVVELEKRS